MSHAALMRSVLDSRRLSKFSAFIDRLGENENWKYINGFYEVTLSVGLIEELGWNIDRFIDKMKEINFIVDKIDGDIRIRC